MATRLVRLLLFFALLGLAATIQSTRPHFSSKDSVKFKLNEGVAIFSAQAIQIMSFGYARMFSSLLWVRFLQAAPTEKLAHDEVSWIYLDLDTISMVDPDFYPIFSQGAPFLSVITEDKQGARLLLEKGVRLFPNIWQIHAYLGYHYYFELNEPELAYKQYLAVAQFPEAPPFYGVLASSLMAKNKGIDQSILFLETLKKQTEDERVKEKLQHKIDSFLKEKEGEKNAGH